METFENIQYPLFCSCINKTNVLIVVLFLIDAYEPPPCQNIPAPNVGTAPGPSAGASSSSNPGKQ